MSDTVISVENLSKMYRLGTVGSSTLAADLNQFIAKVRGKEDPTQKIDVNDRTTKSDSEFVWSLKDVNFDIKKGDAVGIVGRNGAGKSTLLKILSRVTAPTTGSVKIKGRVASLLEVGTGFHPELSGRDNIFMNGAILGMSRAEIRSKFDEIVDFAGVEKYIDTPVKRYSSGMYVRLAFAVSAHLEPDILIVDEVLAVGDAEFQKKCLGKMQDVNNNDGRTVLFVSHNIGAINTLTKTCIYLKNGGVVMSGKSSDVIDLYQRSNEANLGSNSVFVKENPDDKKPIEFLKMEVQQNKNESIKVSIDYKVRKPVGCVVSIKVSNIQEIPVITLRDTDMDNDRFAKNVGTYTTEFELPIDKYAPNIYLITFSLSDMKSERFDYYPNLLSFEVSDNNELQSIASREGVMLEMINWDTTKKI